MAKNYVTQEVYNAAKQYAEDINEYKYLTSVGATAKAEDYKKSAADNFKIVNDYDADFATSIQNAGDYWKANDIISTYSVVGNKDDIVSNILKGKNAWAMASTDEAKKAAADSTSPYYKQLAAIDPQLANAISNWDYEQLSEYVKTGNMPVPAKPETAKPETAKSEDTNVQKPRTAWDVARDIVAFKRGYEGSFAVGSPEYQQEHEKAQKFYAELEAMGPEGQAIASALRGSNADAAERYIAANAPATPVTGNESMVKAQNQVSDYGTTYQDNMQTMYFDPNYGKDIMNMFTLYGGQKGAQAMANAAADNGGNYDSFSEYNKGLTDLSYRMAGANAVQDMRRGYAEDATNFLKTWGDQLITNASNIADYEYKNAELASNERIEMDRNNMEREIARIDAEAERYGYDTDWKIAELTEAGKKYGWNTEAAIAYAGYESEERIAQTQADADVKVAEQTAKATGGTSSPNAFAGMTTFPSGSSTSSSSFTVPKGTGSGKGGEASTETETETENAPNGDVGGASGTPVVEASEATSDMSLDKWRAAHPETYEDIIADVEAGHKYDSEHFLDYVINGAVALREAGATDPVVKEFLGKYGVDTSRM